MTAWAQVPLTDPLDGGLIEHFSMEELVLEGRTCIGGKNLYWREGLVLEGRNRREVDGTRAVDQTIK